MKKEYRVKKNAEIEEILKTKNSKYNQFFSVYKKTNLETGHFRYAMSVGKKIGNAVVRHQYKRLITNVLSNLDIELDQNVDVFIIAKPSIVGLNYNDIYKQIEILFKKHKLIK